MAIDTTIDKIGIIIDYSVMYPVVILMNLFMIMFMYRLYKKVPNFTSAYFRLLIIESLVNGILKYDYFLFYNVFPENIQMIGIFQFWYLFGGWYQYRFYGFCNLLLVLNRFTGVFFWKQHSRIWNGKIFHFAIFLLFIYPFILCGYDLRNAWTCIDVFFYQKPYTVSDNYMTCILTFHNINGVPLQVTISNLTNAVLGLGLGIATALARHLKGNGGTKQKYENRLLIQSIFTSVLFLLYEIFTVIHGIYGANYTANWEILMNDQSYHNIGVIYRCIIFCSSTLFHCSSGILLFIMSEGVRTSFCSFYHLYRLPMIKNYANSVTVISTQSPSKDSVYRLCNGGDGKKYFQAYDSVFPDDPVELIVKNIPEVPISPKYIKKTCTPGCVAPECTRECKCAYTHQEVYATCSPPATSDIATVCQAWYRRCPVFRAMSF